MKYCKRCHSELNPEVTGDSEYHYHCEEAELEEQNES